MSFLRSLRRNKPDESDKGKSQGSEETKRKDICPYCSHHLEKRPTRKKKCPHCGEFIYVRKSLLVTEREAQLSDWSGRLESLGVKREQIDNHYVDLKKQFGFDPPVSDVIWRTLNTLVAKNPGSHKARIAYNEMAHIARSEGKDPLPYLKEAAKLELLEIKGSGIAKAVKVMTVNDHLVCPKCRSLENRDIRLSEALSKLPVPNYCESEHSCRCWYVAVVDY